jgi:predicted alpha-1,2-mannosidase|tara:strand:+ start:8032 stop:10404 length:2373 start_codon:yes stop_codon:yes gene_type:complete
MKKIQLFILLFGTLVYAQRPVDLVNPLIDSANSRWFFFSSATRPFGMVNLSPDMGTSGAWESGYRYNQKTINFFSHIHAWQLSGIPVLPTTGEIKAHLGPKAYGSAYSHESEIVEAGYHSVILDHYNIKAELTSTVRVGFHRYTFPKSDQSAVILDLSTQLGPSGTASGFVKKVSNKKLQGYAVMEKTIRRPKDTKVFFSLHFDRPFEDLYAFKDQKLLGKVNEFKGENGGVYPLFRTKEGEQIMMKVGISYVSMEQAELNLQTELNHWDFEAVVQDSKNQWNDYLSRIEIKGNTKDQQIRFYTDLWHALQGRRIISDVNGKYSDMTGEKQRIGQIPIGQNGKPKFNHYNSDSFWGAQWTLNTLWHLVYPRISEEFVNSLLLMYDDGGLIPRGPSGGNYTYVMTGATTTPFIVSAYMKGIRGFDIEKAYEGMLKNALPGGIMSKVGYEHNTNKGGGIEYYIDKGYVPFPIYDKQYGYHQCGPGVTMEYAYQDWTLAQMAKALNKKSDYKMLQKRASNYRNIYDSSSGWMRARKLDGNWIEPFDPLVYENDYKDPLGSGFVEATAAAATWFVPHDLAGLADLMGGREIAARRLNQSFLIAQQHGFVTHNHRGDKYVASYRRRAFINYGNQPSMQTGYIFNYFGQPWLTQKWVREVIQDVYSDNDPQNGYSGDEDQGLMGALSVLMKIGLFEMKGGADIDPAYDLSSPVFDQIIIHLDQDYYSGDRFTIKVKENSTQNKYIQSVKLNGSPINQSWFHHQDLVKGGTMEYVLGEKPNYEWATAEELLPASMSD